MSIRTPAQVRQDFAARVGALAGWTQAKVPYDQFGTSGVPNGVSMPRGKAKVFVTGLGASVDSGGRQKWAEGIEYKTEVGVKFLRALSAKDPNTSIDAAHADEVELQAQMMAQTDAWPAYFSLRWLSASRSTLAGGGHMLVEHRYAVAHLVNN